MKAVSFLTHHLHLTRDSDLVDRYVIDLIPSSLDESVKEFLNSIVVPLASTNQPILNASVYRLTDLFGHCSASLLLKLVRADLIPKLVSSLNPSTISFAEAQKIHIPLINFFDSAQWFACHEGLVNVNITDPKEKQAVYETVLKQVLVPFEEYLRHLCANHHSFVDGILSYDFLNLLSRFYHISPSYPPTMDYVASLPISHTVTSCCTIFEDEASIWRFLARMAYFQRAWNEEGGTVRRSGTEHFCSLRKEGFGDVIEQRLLNNTDTQWGWRISRHSIEWNQMLGMNIPELV
ncbi:hypothetical protein BLNAU_14786 [Blattamonas nauphoetae]|uniref:Uncharacterized protein n=1 Tax=Blattamonas nauphoetae TaxID=2049346 RepID=A0ABQ9XFU4_9EUKA|nr:hypothetical protein BLNAU_14786 [Blattamonas nauphoetae]